MLYSFGRGFGDPFSFLARLPGLYRVPLPPSTSVFRQLWEGTFHWCITSAMLVLNIMSVMQAFPTTMGKCPSGR